MSTNARWDIVCNEIEKMINEFSIKHLLKIIEDIKEYLIAHSIRCKKLNPAIFDKIKELQKLLDK